jgi:hypothetical protein
VGIDEDHDIVVSYPSGNRSVTNNNLTDILCYRSNSYVTCVERALFCDVTATLNVAETALLLSYATGQGNLNFQHCLDMVEKRENETEYGY